MNIKISNTIKCKKQLKKLLTIIINKFDKKNKA